MHAVSFSYPENPTDEQKRQYRAFFESLAPVIPCPGCSVHYTEHITQNPVKVENTEELSRWVYDLHDKVNKRNKKTSPTYEQVKDDYTGFSEKKNNELLKLSPIEQRRVMADPFMGRLDSDDTGYDVPYNTKSIALGFFAILVVYMFYVYKKHESTKKQVEDKKKLD